MVIHLFTQNTIYSRWRRHWRRDRTLIFFPLASTFLNAVMNPASGDENLLFSIPLYPVTNFLSWFGLLFYFLIIDLYVGSCAIPFWVLFCFIILLLYSLTSLMVITQALFLLLRTSLAIQGILWIHMNFRYLSISVKNVGANLIRIVLKLWLYFDNRVTFTFFSQSMAMRIYSISSVFLFRFLQGLFLS